MTSPARTRKTPLRTSVPRPIGPAAIWPKQRQSGVRPRTRLRAIAIVNAARSAAAAIPAGHANGAESSASARASAASGSATTTAGASRAGTPKSRTPCRAPAWSRSFDAPETAKTPASTRRAARARSATASIDSLLDPRGHGQTKVNGWQTPSPQSLVPAGHWQTPPMQLCPVGHTIPQPPQLRASTLVLISQPLATWPSQFAKPGLQVAIAHTPLTHAAVAFGKVQTMPQPPQFVIEFAVMQRPLHGTCPVGPVA